MNKFVFGALAVTSASTLGFAKNGEDWMTLDREIESLASGMAQGGSGFTLDGWVKTSYADSGDVTVNGNDLGGFSLDSIRANFDGALGDFNVHVAIEGSDDPLSSSNTANSAGGLGGLGDVGNAFFEGVIDAYTTFNITDQVGVQIGFFRPPFLNDSLRDENEFLFIDRTVQGDVWSFRDQGVAFSFMFDQFSAWGGLQNGVDAQGDDLVLTGRAEFHAMGTGVSSTEGAYGSADENNLNLGVGYYDDDNLTDGTAISFDADFSRGPLYAAASLVNYDDGIGFFLPATAVAGETP